MFDQGQGPPIVVVPGIHGRWEWARPMLRQLSQRCRSVSYSLCGDIGSQRHFNPALGFENYVKQLGSVLDEAGIERAAICGVSFGGYVALRFAARYPDRVSALVLASVPGPHWKPNVQQSRWLGRPWWSAPGFVLSSPMRLWPEVSAAIPRPGGRLRFFIRQGLRCAAAPMIPPLMASRIETAASIDFESDCCRIRAATLVLSGEEPLDRVVPVTSTRAYASLIPGAEYSMLKGTGHLGLLTQPDRFADAVSGFVHAHNQ